MRPLAFALVLALVALVALARLSCGGGGAPPPTPGTPTRAQRHTDSAELLQPPARAADRGAAAASAADEGEALAEAAPVLLAGLVVEGRGVGVPGATVRVERHLVDSGGFGMRTVRIEPLPDLTARTDDEGRFEVRGDEAGEVVARAEKAGYVLREALTCTLPAERVTLVVERAGALLATVAPASLDLARKVLVEVRAPGVEHDVDHESHGLNTGRMLREGLAPGTYDVVLIGRLSRGVLLRVPGVQVRPGETTEDPRLLELDLRSALKNIRVTVVDPDERPLPFVTVWVHNGSGESGARTATNGVAVIGAGPDGVDLTVREPGWRRVHRRAVTEDLVLRLERPLTLRLRRAAGRSAELGDLYVHLEPVLPAGDPRASLGGYDCTLRATEDVVEVALDGPGTFRAHWAATLEHVRGGTANFYARDVAPQVFEVAADDAAPEVTLVLDAAAVDELRARLAPLRAELEPRPGESDDERERRVLEVLLGENRR